MAVDYFLKLEGIEGESQAEGHENQMELESWSFGATNTGSMGYGGGGGTGKVSMQDFTVVKKADKGTPKLFLILAKGDHISKAEIFARKAGGKQEEYLTWTFTDCIVTSYQTGGAGEVPLDTISFGFAKIEVAYREQNKDGSLKGPVKAEFDLKKIKGA